MRTNLTLNVIFVLALLFVSIDCFAGAYNEPPRKPSWKPLATANEYTMTYDSNAILYVTSE